MGGSYDAVLEHDGIEAPLWMWAQRIGIKEHTLYYRIFRLGWTIEKALTKKVKREKHGMWGSPERNAWGSMVQRCTNPKNKAYPRYGGRGITVCQEWLDSFQAFFDHMGRRPSTKHSLERVDNGKGYEPGNVVWATPEIQAKNMRTNIPLTFQGRTMILKDWAREVDLPNTTLWNRLFTLGWGVERALTTPKRGRK